MCQRLSTRLWVFALAAFAAGVAASQSDAMTIVYDFTGDCSDCAQAANVEDYIVTGQLIVKNYDPSDLGEFLGEDNFVSFAYNGSNLIDPFNVTEAEFDDAIGHFLFGQLPPGASSNSGSLFLSMHGPLQISCTALGLTVLGAADCDGEGLEFQASVGGPAFWSVGSAGGVPTDFGFEYSWSQTPEPGTAVLLGIGVLGLCLRSRNSGEKG